MSKSESIAQLKDEASCCQECDLYKYATQTVFGNGNSKAPVVLIGEQPGDREDTEGIPFVGPAGILLQKSMEEAGLAPQDCYVTNVVKHFKFEWQGKRRLHKKPRQLEINACLPWLTAELEVVDPSIVVCLGATAAQALLGRNFKVSVERGKWIKTETDRLYFATVHPSSILRAVDAQARHEQQTEFIGDLMLVTEKLRELKSIAESK